MYPKITAVEMLDHIARLKGIGNAAERKETVNYLLNKVNLFDDRNKNLGTYSGGMKQRFSIAQTLMGNPKLIIVDEPTAGLDPVERNRFYNLLSELGENTVVILSTHIVEDVKTLCNEFAIICKGEVLGSGTPDDAVKQMSGKIYRKQIEKEEKERYASEYEVVSTQMKGGKIQLRVYSESDPGNGFVAVEPVLEDFYFHRIASKMDLVTL